MVKISNKLRTQVFASLQRHVDRGELPARATDGDMEIINRARECLGRAFYTWDKKLVRLVREFLDDAKVCCADCGGSDVSYAIWYRPNDDQNGDVFGSWNSGDNTFCDDCDDCTNLIDRDGDRELFVAARQKWIADHPIE